MSTPDNITQFPGWEPPKSNYFKVPNSFWLIDDLDVHQRMVLLYILRHTWGFKEFGSHKAITIDEFQNGRKTKNGRLDNGCGVSRGKISTSLRILEKLGYISVETDDSDPARIKKKYMLKMQAIDEDSEPEPESNNEQDSVHVVNTEFTERTQSSRGDNRTEKETIERNLEKEKETTFPAAQEAKPKTETPTPKPEQLPPDEYEQYLSLLNKHFNVHGGRAFNIYHQLRGSVSDKKKHTAYYEYGQLFRDKPVSLTELQGFITWYPTQCEGCSYPTSPETLEDWFGKYRKVQRPKLQTEQLVATEPIVYPRADDFSYLPPLNKKAAGQ